MLGSSQTRDISHIIVDHTSGNVKDHDHVGQLFHLKRDCIAPDAQGEGIRPVVVGLRLLQDFGGHRIFRRRLYHLGSAAIGRFSLRLINDINILAVYC